MTPSGDNQRCNRFVLAVMLLLGGSVSAFAQPVTHVIHISLDGLRPDAIIMLGPTNLPNFYRLRTEGAFTDNARTDYDYTATLPNHSCQLTGRGVLGSSGHHWTNNTDPLAGETLASNQGSYLAGVFDVVHDNGLSTGEYASKTKFSLFAVSWDATNGAPDITAADNGLNKIDVYVNNDNTTALVNTLAINTANQPLNYVFLHLADPDSVGHKYGWEVTPGSEYSNIIKVMDDRLGEIFALVDSLPQLTNQTAIILTADHGGLDKGHADSTLPEDYTVPFYVWGPGVTPGADLYALNLKTRKNPGAGHPDYSVAEQPIRNGEAANVSLQWLGLGPVPGSTINAAQNLAWIARPTGNFPILFMANHAYPVFPTVNNIRYDLQACDNLAASNWCPVVTNISGTGGWVTNQDPDEASSPCRFYRLVPTTPAD